MREPGTCSEKLPVALLLITGTTDPVPTGFVNSHPTCKTTANDAQVLGCCTYEPWLPDSRACTAQGPLCMPLQTSVKYSQAPCASHPGSRSPEPSPESQAQSLKPKSAAYQGQGVRRLVGLLAAVAIAVDVRLAAQVSWTAEGHILEACGGDGCPDGYEDLQSEGSISGFAARSRVCGGVAIDGGLLHSCSQLR